MGIRDVLLTHVFTITFKEWPIAKRLFYCSIPFVETRYNIKKLGRGIGQVHDSAEHLCRDFERLPRVILVERTILMLTDSRAFSKWNRY